jgi:hypothetical protein
LCQDLQKLIQSEGSPEQTKFFGRLRNNPFWIWNVDKHKQEDIKTKGDCCFNHIIGLPIKDKLEKPLFDYECPTRIVGPPTSSTARFTVSTSSDREWVGSCTAITLCPASLRIGICLLHPDPSAHPP